jgi:predicted aconitase/predicted aconitase with swiveling domain
MMQDVGQAQFILAGEAAGPVLATDEPLSFWGGVDPATGRIIDVHHPLLGHSLTGKVLVMPSSRGSCTGSGVLLDLVLSGRGPSALIFRDLEDVLTLGALVAAGMFDSLLPVLRVSSPVFDALARTTDARITDSSLEAGDLRITIEAPLTSALDLSAADRAMLAGDEGRAAQQSMQILCAMAASQGAERLIDVSQGHIDGCIYASPANLTFARKMADLGGQVRIPTTMNAISVDRQNWREQGVPPAFGLPAQQLADAYVQMGCRPSFTCAPYLLDTAPAAKEVIAWSESNAVIYANTVLGARTAKHPDFLDLCIALTGRAPLSGVYLDAARKAQRVINVHLPDNIDDGFWPLVGYMAGRRSPDRIPLLCGLAPGHPSSDDLKALCAAFGTTSASPMLHIEGVTPEAGTAATPDADRQTITRDDLRAAWAHLNGGEAAVELVAIGSPHASVGECRALADGLAGRRRHPGTQVVVTAGREVIRQAGAEGLLTRLRACGVQVIQDICWCSIREPVFPPGTRTALTNSGKYAHYGPGLSGRVVRLGSLSDCITAALTGQSQPRQPSWLD